MSGINLGTVSGSLAPQMKMEEGKLNKMLDNADVSDPVAMVKMQMEYARYNMEIGFESAIVKDLKDAVSQITQRL